MTDKLGDMDIFEELDLDALLHDPENPRLHPEDNLRTIEESLQDIGAARSITIDESNTIWAGNGVVEAARRLGFKKARVVDAEDDELVAVRVRGKTPEQLRKYSIADNRTNELSTWDPSRVLAAARSGIDLSSLFDPDTMKDLQRRALSGRKKDADPEAIPSLGSIPVARSKPGDLWQCGRHRILCGDSREIANLATLLEVEGGSVSPSVLFTDPPYGIGLDIEGDELSGEDLDQFNRDWITPAVSVLNDNAAVVIFSSSRTFPSALDAARGAGLDFLRLLTIYKPNDMTFPWRSWILKSEVVLLLEKGRARFLEVHPYAHDTYLQNHGAATLSAEIGDHPAAKPYPVIRDILSRLDGDAVLELFLGSGTALIAAEELGRTLYALEKKPAYVDVSLKRWEDFTGQKAELLKRIT